MRAVRVISLSAGSTLERAPDRLGNQGADLADLEVLAEGSVVG